MPAPPPPLSPAILKHRTWSPRHTSDSSEVALSPVSLKHTGPSLDPVTPPNQELLSVQISPPAQQGGPGEVILWRPNYLTFLGKNCFMNVNL